MRDGQAFALDPVLCPGPGMNVFQAGGNLNNTSITLLTYLGN